MLFCTADVLSDSESHSSAKFAWPGAEDLHVVFINLVREPGGSNYYVSSDWYFVNILNPGPEHQPGLFYSREPLKAAIKVFYSTFSQILHKITCNYFRRL